MKAGGKKGNYEPNDIDVVVVDVKSYGDIVIKRLSNMCNLHVHVSGKIQSG